MKLKRILLELHFAQRPCKCGRLHAVEPAGLLAPLRFNMRKATHKGWLFAWQITLILIKDAPLSKNCTPYGSFAPPQKHITTLIVAPKQ